jgi:hypothetical protein
VRISSDSLADAVSGARPSPYHPSQDGTVVLDGKSKTIIVEPVRKPEQAPVPQPAQR